MKKILHVVPCADETNGVYRVALMLAREQCGQGLCATVVTAAEFLATDSTDDQNFDEIWVHGLWLPRTWRTCWRVLRARRPMLVRMTHGSLSPVYLEQQSKWKKRLVSPIERALMRRADRVVVTCAAEADWVRAWLAPGDRPNLKIEVRDLKRFFNFSTVQTPPKMTSKGDEPLHVLYLGRRHPLKGIQYLEEAVRGLERVELRVVSDHRGEALERDWAWCEVLCLPTLSENFGLVVAEALERGKRVITTDGAPAWETSASARLLYLRGFRTGSDETRIHLLRTALTSILGHPYPTFLTDVLGGSVGNILKNEIDCTCEDFLGTNPANAVVRDKARTRCSLMFLR